ncbi:MAG: CHAT domain-containing protein, partial [Cyanobacteria bacterium P01_A01_bin.83]
MRSPVSICRCLLFLSLVVPVLTVQTYLSCPQLQAQPLQTKQKAQRNYQEARESIAAGSLFVAKPKLQQALKIYQALGDRQGQSKCYLELARIDYLSGKYQQARSQLRLANQAANHRSNNGTAKTLEGLIALELGDYREALSHLRVGVHKLRVDRSKDRLGRQELNQAQIALGEVYFYQGLYQQAQVNLRQALRVAHNSASRRQAYNVLGSIQLEIGQYNQALQTFEQAAAVANTPGDRLGKAKTLENLGRAYQLQGDKSQALKQYQLALNDLRSIGAWSRQVYVLNNLGLLAMDLGLSNRALEYFKSAEGTLSNSGGVGQVITYINLGNYYSRQQKFNLAVEYLERALSWATSNGDRIGQAKALTGLGAIEFEQQDFRNASKTLESSVTIYESLRPGLRDEQKIALAESQKQTYDLLQQAYVGQGKSGAALVTAERGRARAFIELLAQRTAAKSDLEVAIKAPSLEEIKAIARKRQGTLVSYSIIEDQQGNESQLYIWVVNSQGVHLRQLDLTTIKQQFKTSIASVSDDARRAASGGLDLRKPRLQDYVVSFRGDIRADSPTERHKLSFPRDAYKLLMAPIKDLLPKDPNKLVVLIPQGSLFLVPFPALQDSAGEFLIEQHTLQISPSIQNLAMQPSGNSDLKQQPLIVGNPEPMPKSLSPLSGAEAEAQAIAEILQTSPLIGQAATEDTVVNKMQHASLIHLATHGLFNEHQGLESSLAFSTSDNSEGFLTAAEILDLELSADLVVLSACNTGRGKITGDGVVGLSRSFLLAGAKNTLVSLWYVPDISTSALMTNFYSQLQVNPNKPQALRQAMLDTMKVYP